MDTNERRKRVAEIKKTNPDWGRQRISEHLGAPPSNIQRDLEWLKKQKEEEEKTESEFELTDFIPDREVSVEKIVAIRKAEFAQRMVAEEARKLVNIRVKIDGPIGICHFGDPHIDDPGCDIAKIESVARIVRETPGLFASNIGDMNNNWIGRLSALHAKQSTTAKMAWKLVEWMFGLCDWLYLVGGNHDAWSGDRNILDWMAAGQAGFYDERQVRVCLNFPNGHSVRINARHNWKGYSIYNDIHGQLRAAKFGWRDHLLVGGHKHISGYGLLKDPMTGLISHLLQVASFKTYDDYAATIGADDKNFSCCPVTVINPKLPETDADMIHVFYGPEQAAEYLTWARSRK